MAGHRSLLALPPELLSYLFLHLSTASFVQTILTCRQLFSLASQSRDAILAHLNELPGIKLGLQSITIPTQDLFLLVRQRASASLYGAEIHGNCTDVRPRSGTLNASASGLRDSADYFNISLALKESLNIRHCGFSGSLLKDHIPSPYADGAGTIIQIVQGRHTVSVLYAWEPDEVDGKIACPRPPPLRPIDPLRNDPGPLEPSEDSSSVEHHSHSRVRYHIVHYNAYNADRPDFFILPDSLGVTMYKDSLDLTSTQRPEPVHLAVYNRRKCAIVWRVFSPSSQNRNDLTSAVVLYETDRLPTGEAGVYEATTMIPYSKKPVENQNIDPEVTRTRKRNRNYFQKFSTRATAFADGGHRIKLYHPGSVTPYAIIPTQSVVPDDRAYQYAYEYNMSRHQEHDFRSETPFYASHQTLAVSSGSGDDENDVQQCELTYLALAWLTPDDDDTKLQSTDTRDLEDTLFITQSHERLDFDDCDHSVPNLAAIDVSLGPTERVVARLRGLSECWMPTNMTALDTISISQNGTRIAIACWDKVLVYVLDPSILAEDWTPVQVEASEDGSDDDDDDGSQSTGTQAESDGNSHGQTSESSGVDADSSLSNRSTAQSSSATLSMADDPEPEVVDDRPAINENAMIKAARYYKLTDDPRFGEIVELWPIILRLPGQAVARKMMWGKAPSDGFAVDSPSGGDASEDDTSDEAVEDKDKVCRRTNADNDADADADDAGQIENWPTHRPADSDPQDIEAATTKTVSTHWPRLDCQPQSSEAVAATPTASLISTPNAAAAEEVEASQVPSEASEQEGNDDDDAESKAKARGKAKDKGKGKARRKRRSEDELVVLTDRGLQLWNLGPRAKGRRTTRWLWDA